MDTLERETALAEKLRDVGYDLNLLTEAQRTEIFALARSAHVELWSPARGGLVRPAPIRAAS